MAFICMHCCTLGYGCDCYISALMELNVTVRVFGCSGVCESDPRFIQFALASCYAVNIIKVYIERNNMQVELIRFGKK